MNTSQQYEHWLNEVDHELISMGYSSCEATSAVSKNDEWFREQFDADLPPIAAADKWFVDHSAGR